MFKLKYWGVMCVWLLAGFAVQAQHHVWQLQITDSLLGAVGAEDITVLQATGYAFISSDDRRATMDGDTVQGAIYGLDLQAAVPHLAHLTMDFREELHPHGISFLPDAYGGGRLFVVNHRKTENTVEIFEWEEGALTHVETVRNPALLNPNDILAVAPRKFYFTNDHGSRGKAGKMMEDLFRTKKCSVGYFDGDNWSVAARKIGYANGINISPDGSTVYVAGVFKGRVHAYRRDPKTGGLTLLQTAVLNSGADNIEMTPDGTLWVACHSSLVKFVGHALNAQKLSPWQLFSVRFDPAYTAAPQLQEVYRDNGRKLSGVSVAAVWKDKVLVGSVFEQEILIGILTSPTASCKRGHLGQK